MVANKKRLESLQEPVPVGEIVFLTAAGVEVKPYVEGGPGRIALVAMSDGTFRWAR